MRKKKPKHVCTKYHESNILKYTAILYGNHSHQLHFIYFCLNYCHNTFILWTGIFDLSTSSRCLGQQQNVFSKLWHLDFEIPRHSKFSINLHKHLSGNPLSCWHIYTPCGKITRALYSLFVLLEITLMFQCIRKRQSGFTKGVSFPCSTCNSLCCKAPGSSFFIAVHLPVLECGSLP